MPFKKCIYFINKDAFADAMMGVAHTQCRDSDPARHQPIKNHRKSLPLPDKMQHEGPGLPSHLEKLKSWTKNIEK